MKEQDLKEQDLTLSGKMQEVLDRMAAMQAELDSLKAKAPPSPSPSPSSQTFQTHSAAIPPITGTRRNTLKRLGLALLGGAVAATVTSYSPAQAKILANPGTSKVGAIVLSPNASTPINAANATYQYGLVALAPANATPFDLTTLPTGNTGVYGNSSIYGVYGKGGTFGVYGSGTNSGVYGSGSYGVYGSGTDKGVVGSGTNTGVYGGGDTGLYGSGNTYGVQAYGDTGVYGLGGPTGVYGEGNTYGVQGLGGKVGGAFSTGVVSPSGTAPSTTFVGLVGLASNLDLSTLPTGANIGVLGVANFSTNYYAGYFRGNVNITGSISKGSGTFKIDHPLDPANKYLYHSFVESPDMMNIYNGIAALDEQGEAVVEMPVWFEALNTDFRYQLTSIGVSMPDLFIAGEITNRQFKIAGGKPGQRVSWQVTGIRQDAFAKAYRSPVEQEKPEDDKGTYLHPELFGQTADGSGEMADSPRPVMQK